SQCVAVVLAVGGTLKGRAAEAASGPVGVKSDASAVDTTPEPPPQIIFIREYRVLRAKNLPRIDIEEAVYPYIRPGRTIDDARSAAASLENAYRDKGFIAQ